MINEYTQFVVTSTKDIGDIKCPNRTAYQFLGILMTVEGYGSISTYTFKLEKVTLVFVLVGIKDLIIYCTTVQIAVAQLAVALVIIEVVGNVYVCRDGIAAY